MVEKTINPPLTTTNQDVSGSVGVPSRNWYVAIVNSRHEKKVAERLEEQGYDTFVAIQPEMRLWNNGRKKMVDRVIIPSMVFVKCTERERREIVGLPYINRFLVNRAGISGGIGKPIAIIRESEIEKLRFMLGQSDTPVGFVPTVFNINDNVRVIRGKLKGLEGQIMRNSDGTHTLMVAISILGGATVAIDPQDVQKLK